MTVRRSRYHGIQNQSGFLHCIDMSYFGILATAAIVACNWTQILLIEVYIYFHASRVATQWKVDKSAIARFYD